MIETAIEQINFPDETLHNLYEPIKYSLSAGGKRLRPVLTLLGTDAFNSNPEEGLDAAVGIEIFHNFTLLHDDVMDNSDIRRGRATVQKKYGVNTAILSGDTMLTLATEYISKVPTECLRQILNCFNQVAIKVYEGQRLDMDFEKRDLVSEEEYTRMVSYKTGALLGGAVKIGALIGGASEHEAELMFEYGMNIGIAFQIQDDYLDTFGDSSSFGKMIGGDINNSKKTFLYVWALNGKDNAAEALKSAFQIPQGEMRIKTVTRLYEKAGMPEKCKKAVNAYLANALKSLNETSLSQEAKESFRYFAEKLIGRKK